MSTRTTCIASHITHASIELSSIPQLGAKMSSSFLLLIKACWVLKINKLAYTLSVKGADVLRVRVGQIRGL